MTTEIVVTENNSSEAEELPVEQEEAASLALAVDAVALSEQVAASAALQAAEREAENIRRIEKWQAETAQALESFQSMLINLKEDLAIIRLEMEILSTRKADQPLETLEAPQETEKGAEENQEPKTKALTQKRRWI